MWRFPSLTPYVMRFDVMQGKSADWLVSAGLVPTWEWGAVRGQPKSSREPGKEIDNIKKKTFFVTLHFLNKLILQKDGQHQEEDGEAVQRDGGRRVENRPLWGDQGSEWGWGGQVRGAGNRSGITSEILDWVFQKRQVRNIQKKMQAMESAFDVCTEDLFNQVSGYLVQYCLFKDKSNVGQVHYLAWLGILGCNFFTFTFISCNLVNFNSILTLSRRLWSLKRWKRRLAMQRETSVHSGSS